MNRMPKIGKHELRSRVLVAPMSGLTDLPFRRVLQQFKPGLVVSEMVASEFLAKGKADIVAKASGKGEIEPLVIQLVGREAKWMAEGAKLSEEAGAKIIDINMGCPARKVTAGLSGSALMRNLDHALELIEATVNAVEVPVTLKMRLGWDFDCLNAPELASRAEAAGVQMVVVHGRTRNQFYTGEADWKAVKATKDAVSVPVFVNGDIHTPQDALEALEQSGADGVMLGRSLIGAPWNLRDIITAVDGLPLQNQLPNAEKGRIAISHYRDLIDFYGEGKGIRIARKHLAGYVEHLNLPEEAELRSQICRSFDPNEVIGILDRLYGVTKSERAA
ncbi:tRNA dihydrouridine synthase DusB [Hellea balneolensis]|uniref:tRNA dihydrouridine synthase DusB n=1 Tax=Hellea balneolensis TaxID=287478 RepID=UPI00040E01F7|nr:tRNA dihydrouridine synthase DusB [Hellea balneolensis]